MATYKLIQDIEAEDKILGPLTLRQFVFGLITAFFLYICFILAAKKLYFVMIPFIPPALFFGFFAFPFGRDQPTELWALGKLNYYFKPRKRIWDQSGVKELVTVTVPKKIEHIYTDGLSQTEVRSRLQALANTIDSRGWAVKNVNATVYQPQLVEVTNSDRLVELDNIPQEVPGYELTAADDMMDEANNPIARQFDSMIAQSGQQHREQIVDQMNAPAPLVSAQPASGAAEPWFINPAVPVPMPANPIGQTTDDRTADAALSSELKSHAGTQSMSYGNLRTLQPLSSQPLAVPPLPALPPLTSADATQDDSMSATSLAMTATDDPAILNLANNNDLNVSTLAREAQKAKQADDDRLREEVVISFH